MEPEALMGTDLIEGAVAHRLARELESAFKRAVLPLEDPIEVRSGQGEKNPRGKLPLHSYFVLLFRSAFPEVSWDKVSMLCRMDRIYTEHLPVYDRIVEQQGCGDPLALFLAHWKVFHGLKGLYGLFPPGHAFWGAFEGCHTHTWKAGLHERLHHHFRVAPYPLSEFEYVAAGKVALYKVFSLALAHLTGRSGAVDMLSRSLDQYHLGVYFLDDLQDWREDYVSSNFTFPLTRLILENNLEDAVMSGVRPPLWKIGTLFYETGIAAEQISNAEERFRRASELVEGENLPHWIHVLQCCIRRCGVLAGHLRQSRGKKPGRSATDRGVDPAADGRMPEVVLHPGMSEKHLVLCRSVMRQCAALISAPAPMRVHIGNWPSVAGHFVLARADALHVGINLESAPDVPVVADAEIARTYAEAVRLQCRGAMHGFLERLFVRGVAIMMCARLWPERPMRDHAAMSAMEWRWCEKNEWLLWEAAVQEAGIEAGAPEHGFVFLALPSVPISHAPDHAWSYLALRMVEKIARHKLEPDPVCLLTRTKAGEIERGMERYCRS